MATIYVTGHRNPDADSIASAIGYAELKGRIDTRNSYIPSRLGEVNAQTQWLLERSGAKSPQFLPHVMVRACDVMQSSFPTAHVGAPIRQAGLEMARAGLELVPVVDDDGALVGVLTERALARRYVRETREASTLRDAPTKVSAIVEALGGKLLAGEDQLLSGRVWVHSMDPTRSGASPGDVVVVGNRADAQRLAIERGAQLLVLSNDSEPDDDILALAQERGVAVIVSALDSYVSGRMITLAAPCGALMESDPLTATSEFLVDEISEQIKESHYGAAVVIDPQRHPIGLVTRSDLVAPPRRRVLLVDHAEQAQSVSGVEQAEIVEILDHHHIGSIETRLPVAATFDPVGSTATLVVERFRQSGMEPSPPTAMMLLGAVMSDTIILNSATTTDRDRRVVEYLERALAIDAMQYGREMFEATADVSEVSAEQIISRDAKQYHVSSGHQICIAQIEVVGRALMDRKDELIAAMRKARESRDLQLYALMVTDVLTKGTDLLVAGDVTTVARTFGTKPHDSTIELPGVMSRKKEVAPKLLAAM
ncbi:MAG TPA: putative manganese-dependent inorganic diphosphatase [Solirubrobacteraceae bacterium]